MVAAIVILVLLALAGLLAGWIRPAPISHAVAIVLFVVCVAGAGILTAMQYPISAHESTDRSVADARGSAASTSMKPAQPAATGHGDAIKNLQLSLSPPTIKRTATTRVHIDTSDGSPNSFVDVEIASPNRDNGGVCPKIIRGPCNLIYSGGGQADADGSMQLSYTWDGRRDATQFPSGTYIITVQDRGSGEYVSIDLTVTS